MNVQTISFRFKRREIANERILIEKAFLERVLHTIICTSTLSTGVNLPAERVVIMPWTSKFAIPSKQTLIQMKGRAGRTGFCNQAYIYFVSPKEQFSTLLRLVETDEPEEIKSTLTSTLKPLVFPSNCFFINRIWCFDSAYIVYNSLWCLYQRGTQRYFVRFI